MRNPLHRMPTDWADDLLLGEAEAERGETVPGDTVLAELVACLMRLDAKRPKTHDSAQGGTLPAP